MALINQYAQMKLMLREMEKDLGLEQMSRAEKAILSALCALQAGTDNDTFIASSAIKNHPLCSDLAAPTFFRGLAALLENGTIMLPVGRAKGLYRLAARMVE